MIMFPREYKTGIELSVTHCKPVTRCKGTGETANDL
jgi:hypothetical protein